MRVIPKFPSVALYPNRETVPLPLITAANVYAPAAGPAYKVFVILSSAAGSVNVCPDFPAVNCTCHAAFVRSSLRFIRFNSPRRTVGLFAVVACVAWMPVTCLTEAEDMETVETPETNVASMRRFIREVVALATKKNSAVSGPLRVSCAIRTLAVSVAFTTIAVTEVAV